MAAETSFELPLTKTQKQIAKNQSLDSKANTFLIY
jgi:hypothetical protein